MAWERGGKLGGEVGCQVRFEDHLGPESRLCFVTEGILLRWLQDNPSLDGVGMVVFDEFHERNLLSDVALALVKQLRRTTRPDHGVVVMSATLEAEPVGRYLADAVAPGHEPSAAPVLSSDGRTFPVELRWADYNDVRPEWEKAASAVEHIVSSGWEGDVLVFMPGMAEIQSTLRCIGAASLGERVALLPLHGDLPPEEQDRVFQPCAQRKVVVSTNVAETSVTIDGVRHVVDSGLARESVVQDAPLFVGASVREITGRTGRLTLVKQCTAARVEWLREMFPQHFETRLEHVHDRHHKRVAAIDMARFLGLVIEQKHRKDVDPAASGVALADAVTKGWLDLPNLDHRVQQWVARVECLGTAVPELELPSMRGDGWLKALQRAFHGLTVGREAQQLDLLPAFRGALSSAQQALVNELAPAGIDVAVPGQPQSKAWNLNYVADKEDPDAPPVPEVQVKITDILALKVHPLVAEGRVPVRIWVMDPAGKRLGSTLDWLAWRATEYVRLHHGLRAKNPGFIWT